MLPVAAKQVNAGRDHFTRVTPLDNHLQLRGVIRAQCGIAHLR